MSGLPSHFPDRPDWPDRPAWAVGAVAGLLVLGLAGDVADLHGHVSDRTLVALIAVTFGALGTWLWARAVPVIGRRMTWVGLAAAINWVAQCWSGSVLGAWASQWTWFAPVLLVPLILTRFPDGQQRPGRARVLEPALALSAALIAVLLAAAAVGAPRTLLSNPGADQPVWSTLLVQTALVITAVWAASAVAQLGVLVTASVRRTGADRGQLLALGLGLVATLAGVAGLVVADAFVFQLVVALALPVAIGVAVLRYALYDLDLLVHRFAVWVVLTAAIVAGTAAIVRLIADATPSGLTTGLEVGLLTALVLVLDPLRRVVQRAVGRLLFGRRGAPEEALVELGRGLGSATAQQSREQLCRSVGDTLALPWVGLAKDGTTLAAWGRPTSAPLDVPLLDGTMSLRLAPRRAGERFGPADLQVIHAMAAQVEVAVRAVEAADDLQRARDGLVRSREEERKRLRNDLHDGVGPTLAGIRLQVHALARRDAAPWQQLDEDLAVCAAEIARVIEGLRPPVLDEGLVRAVQREAGRWSRSGVRVQVGVDELDAGHPLPAAVEIAAYRIIAEAVSNAVRHGQARTVTITLRCEPGTTTAGASGVLGLEVEDDGHGVVEGREGGVGLSSMRDRAEELGGTLTVCGVPDAGTTVAAVLPIGRGEVRDG